MTDDRAGDDLHKLPAWALRIAGAVSMLIMGAGLGWLALDRNQAWEYIHESRNRTTALEARVDHLTDIRQEIRDMDNKIEQLQAAVARLAAKQ